MVPGGEEVFSAASSPCPGEGEVAPAGGDLAGETGGGYGNNLEVALTAGQVPAAPGELDPHRRRDAGREVVARGAKLNDDVFALRASRPGL